MGIVCVAKEEAILGEAPRWCPEDGLLYWLDILGKKIFSFNPASGKSESFLLPEEATSINLKRGGGLILTFHNSVVSFDFKTKETSLLFKIDRDRGVNRCNDANCDLHGRLWVGTRNFKNAKHPSGSLYRIDPDGAISVQEENLACANGIGWSPDNRTMYFAESFEHAVYAYDFDPERGKLSNKRVFASGVKGQIGYFDGLAVDQSGFVWVAIGGKGEVVRFNPNGEIDTSIPIPVPFPTSCGFGGKNRSTLFVTTSREVMSKEEIARYPLSGSLFAIETKTRGLPSYYF